MKRKIKIVTKGNFPYGGAGANYVKNLSIALHCQGYDVQIILATGNINNIEIAANDILTEIKSISLRSIQSTRNSFLRKVLNSIQGSFNFAFYIIKSKFKKDVDVIINYDIFFSSAIVVVILAKILKIKLIYILPEYYSKPTKHRIKYYDFFCGINWLANFSDGLIVLSTFMQNYFENYKKYKNPILLIPNIIDLKEFEREGITPFNERKITIGYAGTPTEKDGIKDLFLSFSVLARRNNNVHLLIIGDTTNGYSVIPELEEFASKLGIYNKTTFTGLVPFCSVPDLLLSCDILALTRKKGIASLAGFPTKLGEYFACKKPVLVTKVGDIGNYFSNGIQVVLSEPGDIKNIAEGFARLISDPELSKGIALNGYRWAQENLEYRIISKKVQNWLETEIFRNL